MKIPLATKHDYRESFLTGSGISIILPVLNEADNIDKLLETIRRELSGKAYVICLIDDGSKDGTVDKIKVAMQDGTNDIHLIQRQKTWKGSQRGSALKVGMLWSLDQTDCVVFVEMDGDLSHRPEELKGGAAIIEQDEYDVVIASKYAPGSSVVHRPLGRRLVSRICSIAVGALITRKIRDYSNGYRFYSRSAAQVIADHEIKYGSPIYLTEVLSIWLRSGMRVVEIPSIYVGRDEGLSKLRIRDLLKAAFSVCDICIRYHANRFNKRDALHPTTMINALKETHSDVPEEVL